MRLALAFIDAAINAPIQTIATLLFILVLVAIADHLRRH